MKHLIQRSSQYDFGSNWWTTRGLSKPTQIQLWLWNMTVFERIIYLDSDMLLLRPVDELFEIPVT